VFDVLLLVVVNVGLLLAVVVGLLVVVDVGVGGLVVVEATFVIVPCKCLIASGYHKVKYLHVHLCNQN
jgi:hypothetical protein